MDHICVIQHIIWVFCQMDLGRLMMKCNFRCDCSSNGPSRVMFDRSVWRGETTSSANAFSQRRPFPSCSCDNHSFLLDQAVYIFCSLFFRLLSSFVCCSSWKWTRPLRPADSVVGRASDVPGFRRSASAFCGCPNVTGHICPGIIHHIKDCFLKRRYRTFFFPPIYRRFLSFSPNWRLSELKLAVMWIWNA